MIGSRENGLAHQKLLQKLSSSDHVGRNRCGQEKNCTFKGNIPIIGKNEG
jgi:hypothetical protein